MFERWGSEEEEGCPGGLFPGCRHILTTAEVSFPTPAPGLSSTSIVVPFDIPGSSTVVLPPRPIAAVS
ncbi:hypothetical protein H5410_032014 [Solanum commersonii]|uniref:Uncharacterized protein n=1 Tax=Solanum commersonii TaxID=4109 RepID=A0A9J5YNE4_SOLCO|nr:hypothetical protein H5410_032014 [Solanum commersonii]